MVGKMYFKDGYTEGILGYGYGPKFYCFTRSGNYLCEPDEVTVTDAAGHVLWVTNIYTWYKYSHEVENWLVVDVDCVTIYKEE